MNWCKLLDKVEKKLIKEHGIDEETAKFLCFVSDSHYPWFEESHNVKFFSKKDVDRLTNWLLEKKEERGFI